MTYRRRHFMSSLTATRQQQQLADSTTTQQQATLCVSVLRATGLQQAALAAAASAPHQDTPLHYAATVGLNVYCRFRLSFERAGERTTRPMARTFTPEWEHCAEMALPLMWPQQGALSAVALAELLEEGYLELQLWHQAPVAARQLGAALQGERHNLADAVPRYEDTLLGTLALPLGGLLAGSALKGWYALCAPSVDLEKDLEPRCVGGLDLCVRWAKRDDLERVLEAARQIGFTPLEGDFDSFDVRNACCDKVVVYMRALICP